MRSFTFFSVLFLANVSERKYYLTLIGTRFLPHVKNQGGGVKNTPEENLQYLGSLTSNFDEIFTVSSQMNLAYNPVEILELPCRMTS